MSAQFNPLGPGRERPELPEFESKEKIKFVLPPARVPEKIDKLSGGVKIFVRRFEFNGNKVYSDEDLRKITAPYENRIVDTVEIQEVRRNITLHYINNGYINSGAILEDQKISDGVIKLKIIEGELTAVEVSGNKRLKSSYISDRLRLGAGPPLNLNDMQVQLRLMQQNPLIGKVNAELLPGGRPGESILKVIVDERRPYQLSLFMDNYRSPSVGAFAIGTEAVHRNLTGRGDTISLRFVKSKGLTERAISYAIPLNARDTTLKLRYNDSKSIIIEKPFDLIEVESKSKTIGVELTHPVYRTPNTTIEIGLGLDIRSSETFLSGQPFSFSLGPLNGSSAVSVIRFTQKLSHRLSNQALSLRSQFSFGIDKYGATIHNAASKIAACGANPATICPDGDFIAWLGQAQYARRFAIAERNLQLVTRLDAQFADDPLLSLEQYSIGGVRTVRGYRENQITGDNGVVASVEVRIPVTRNLEKHSPFTLVPFLDYGHIWNEERTTPNPQTVSSIGVGLLWDPDPKFHAELYFAATSRKFEGESEEHDLQDAGVHYRMNFNFF